MKLIRKRWFKVLLSLFIGGMTAELIHITTGNPDREMEFNPSLIVAVVAYFMISLSLYIYDYYKVKSKNS